MATDRGEKGWRNREGREWRLGSKADLQWIEDGTEYGVRITSAIPPAFEAYATLEHPGFVEPGVHSISDGDQERHDAAVWAILNDRTPPQAWWLGYLETGASKVVFDDAPRARLYADWPYVVVEAGPEQARTWRGDDWKGSLPDLVFPADRSWLFSTLWDDDWTCIGGSRELVDAFLADPELRDRVREVDPSIEDATPPGHIAY